MGNQINQATAARTAASYTTSRCRIWKNATSAALSIGQPKPTPAQLLNDLHLDWRAGLAPNELLPTLAAGLVE
jgi:hypothetical protein